MKALGILFAAAGHGKAMAHFDPQNFSINLTRGKGDGTVCHEMGHYIDKMIEEKFRLGRNSEKNHAPYASYTKGESRNVSNPHIMEAMLDLMTFIKQGLFINKTTLEVQKEFYHTRYKNVIEKIQPYFHEFIQSVVNTTVTIPIKADKKKKFRKNYSTFEDAVNYYKTSYESYFNYNYYLEHKSKVTAFFSTLINTYDLETYDVQFNNNPKNNTPYSNVQNVYTRTSYYLKNQAMKSDYWTFDWELFARGFETYIFDKMAKNNRSNNYLVSGSYFDRPEGVYAYGVERDILYILYDELFNVVKREMKIKDFTPFREERVNEYILLGNNDKEDKKVIEDAESGEEVIDSTEEEMLIEKGREILQKLIEMLTTKNTFEQGGELLAFGLVPNLFKFAASGS